jgi:hypothetical protein
LTADRSKQREFEQKEAKVTKGKLDWRFGMGPSTNFLFEGVLFGNSGV